MAVTKSTIKMFQYFLPKNANQFEIVSTKVILGLFIFSVIFCLISSQIEHGDDTPFLVIGILDLLLIGLFYQTKSIILVGNLYLMIWYLVLTRLSLNTGGIYSMDALSLIFAPLIAYCTLGRMSGNIWLGLFALSSFYLWYLAGNESSNLLFKQAREGFDRNYFLAGHIMFITLFTAIFYLFFYHFNQLILKLNKRKEELSKSFLLLKHQSELLEKSKKELQRSNKELEEYANATSHDLKQPIRNVNNFASLLHRHLTKEDKLDKRSEEMLGFITEGSDRMLNLISDLLSFAKMKTERDIVFEEVELDTIVEKTLFNLKSTLEKTGTSIQVTPLPKALVIPVKMGQVFQNLISNAIKFRKKEELLVITINAIDKVDHIHFTIQDNGIGIEEEFIDKIFAPFKKLHAQSEYKGSGIGLATCNHIIELHQGTIWVDSVFGKGSTFHFTISKMLNTAASEGRMVLNSSELN